MRWKIQKYILSTSICYRFRPETYYTQSKSKANYANSSLISCITLESVMQKSAKAAFLGTSRVKFLSLRFIELWKSYFLKRNLGCVWNIVHYLVSATTVNISTLTSIIHCNWCTLNGYCYWIQMHWKSHAKYILHLASRWHSPLQQIRSLLFSFPYLSGLYQ